MHQISTSLSEKFLAYATNKDLQDCADESESLPVANAIRLRFVYTSKIVDVVIN